MTAYLQQVRTRKHRCVVAVRTKDVCSNRQAIMSAAGMAYSYRPQTQNSLPGTLNPTTKWRQMPFNNTNDTLSLLQFENIAGDTVPIPNGVTVLELRNGLAPAPVAQLGQQYILEWAKSYEIRQGRAVVKITNQRQQSVSASGGARVLSAAPLPVPAPHVQPAVELDEEPLEEIAGLQMNE